MKSTLTIFLACLLGTALQGQNAKFNWVKWDKVSAAVKADLKRFKVNKTKTLYDDIIETNTGGVEVFVAVTDLDGDGQKGYAVASEGGNFWCGTDGCPFEVYEDGGKKNIVMVDHWELIKPAKNGVISSTGHFISLKPNPMYNKTSR